MLRPWKEPDHDRRWKSPTTMRKNDTFSDGATASSPNAVICLIKPGRPRLDYCPAPGTRSICIRIPGVAEGEDQVAIWYSGCPSDVC